ncbi:MAG TPA: magnesium transporter [Gemmataceae bacterium]|nr:magnesium transporter [Gemmataceae bacterium]
MPAALTEAHLADPVTAHMRRDFVHLGAGQTVAEALADLRSRQPPGRIVYFYVTDADGRLVGVVPTRRLLLSPPDRPLAEVMVRPVVALPDTATVLDACEFFTLHRLLAFPVVDADRRLVGVVDVELYTDELSGLGTPERPDDLFQLIGVHLTEAQQASPLLSFRHRFPWLLCNVAGGILAAFLSGLYEEQLQRAVALALFIPVVLALAESVGIQSVSLALETLHGRSPTWASLLTKARRELLTGLLLGGACGVLVGLVALAWLRQGEVALCLLGGIGGGVAAAAVVGLAVPYLLRLLRLNPQVAAGPIALAGADMLTLLVYFNLARWLLVAGA